MSLVVDLDWLEGEANAHVLKLGAVSPPSQRTVDGAPGGVHRAARRGGGIEFAEHRDYVPGDDLRYVDWKAYARSDRYTVKRFEQEVHASVTLLLDASASMQLHGAPAPDKMLAVRLLCATLATWIVRNGDAVGLVVAGRSIDVPAAGGRAHLRRVLHQLATVQPRGAAGFEGLDRAVLRSAERRGTVLAVSDFLAQPSVVLAPLAQLRRLGPRVLALCALHPVELDLAMHETIEVVCDETLRRELLDPRAVRGAYREMMADHLERLTQRCGGCGVEFMQLDLGADPTTQVRAVARQLARRERALLSPGLSS